MHSAQEPEDGELPQDLERCYCSMWMFGSLAWVVIGIAIGWKIWG